MLQNGDRCLAVFGLYRWTPSRTGVEEETNERHRMGALKASVDDTTALGSPWSLAGYLAWQRAQDERDAFEREAANIHILQRFDPETEAAVRALEEGWGLTCQERA